MREHDRDYQPRIVDATVERHLRAFGAVEIAGTMWSGKTWTSERHGTSRISLDDAQARQLAEIDPDAVLSGEEPRVIDEWQRVPQVWDTVRNKIDDAGDRRGMFILTGSSRPTRGLTAHTGSGRISTVRMWPMTLSETGDSDGSVSLADLFEGRFSPQETDTSIDGLARLICRGGWPGALGLDDDLAELIPQQYIDALVSKDETVAPGSRQELLAFLTSVARNVGGAVTLKTLAHDNGVDVSDRTSLDTGVKRMRKMLDFFLDRYVVTDLHGWDAPIKSPHRLRTSPTHCFADPSLPAALLGVDKRSLMGDMQLFGQLFEELCLRDLRVYASALPRAGAEPLRYYRDADGLEVDAIIELRDGRWAAVEVELGANKADEAFASLRRLRNKIGENSAARNPEPSFLMVLVGKTGFRYRTDDGIYVVPITNLTA